MMPRLVDYFVECGVDSGELEKDTLSVLSSHLPPLCRSYTPKVLTHVPVSVQSNPFDESAIKTLCMPDGLLFKKNMREPQMYFHSFLITREDGTHAYGSVLTWYQCVQDPSILNKLGSLQKLYQAKYKEGTLGPDQQHNVYRRNEDKLFATKCICLVTSQPVFRPLQAYLLQLQAVAGGECSGKLPLESYLYNILYEVAMPAQGKNVRIAGPLGRILWRNPSSLELPLCDYSFKRYFEILGVRNVLKLLVSTLLEHQILLKSSDYETLMLCAHCSTSLLFPFSWQHVFVPILPASQRAFLDAPVPYIMGLRVDPSRTDSKHLLIPNEFSLCMVDLDEGTVECPDELPALPDIDRLLVQVSDLVQEHSVNCPDIASLPTTADIRQRKPSVIAAIRFVKEQLSDQSGQPGTSTQKILSELSLTNPHIPNLINIATRAGMENPMGAIAEIDEGACDLEGVDDEEGFVDGDDVHDQWGYSPDVFEARFASSVREAFASYFVEHFANYENFIIMPTQTYDQWMRNREQFQNFDKTAFLSDQPSTCWAFYAAFLETATFTSFIDQKIVTFWEPDKVGQNLKLFDSRSEAYRDKSGLPKPPTTPGSRPESLSSDADDTAVKEGGTIEETAPLPHVLPGLEETKAQDSSPKAALFVKIDTSVLQVREPDQEERSGKLMQEDVLPKRFYSRPGSGRITTLRGSPKLVHGVLRHRPSGGASAAFSSHSHAKFVNQLWRESRLRVKHMLSSPAESHNYMENTHIAYLCDLLERIWGHGLKKRESKSPLWAHLKAYAELMGAEELPPALPSTPTPTPPHLTSSMSSLAMLSTGADESPRTSQMLRAQFRRRKLRSPQLRSRVEAILQPPPSPLISDLLTVHNMNELKTDVGHARAWVRLALEKKCLSRHLSQLLSNEELCNRRYREYAFLRTEEQREQFLYHLLTLTAKDFSCFTTGFIHATMTYRILVIAEGKHFGLSTACLYVNVGGEYRETGVTEIPRGEYQLELQHRNLGPLTCLRVGHDNSGITPSLLVEMVLVHNLTTGQTYRFNCGRWLARAEDDGSVERFLVSEKVPQTISKSCTISALDVDSVVPSPGTKRRSPRKEERETLGGSDIKHRLRANVDKIKTATQGKQVDRMRQELLQLVHGANGFGKCMEMVFNYGFRSSRKFQKRLYVWDFLERAHEQLSGELSSQDGGEGQQHPQQTFVNVVARINTNNPSIGKDEKALIFFCVGLRDHYLSSWIELVARCPVTEGLYEPDSFLRNPELLQFLMDTLTITQPLVISLEPILTQGL